MKWECRETRSWEKTAPALSHVGEILCSLLAQVLGQNGSHSFVISHLWFKVLADLFSLLSKCPLAGAWKVSGGIVGICAAAWLNFLWLNLIPVLVAKRSQSRLV